MAISFAVLNSVLPSIIDAKFPILIRGRHGIGKSTIVYQIAEQRGLPVVERRASQMTEGDLLGLPKVEGNVTMWLAPEWLHQACNNPVVLFLDEVDRATLEVRQGIFELCDSRKIAGYTLHPDTIIFACVNGGGDPADLPQSVRACEVLVNAVASLLDTDRYEFVKWDREWYMTTVAEMVVDVYAITESLEEGCYGVDLCDRMNAFMVKVEQLEDQF